MWLSSCWPSREGWRPGARVQRYRGGRWEEGWDREENWGQHRLEEVERSALEVLSVKIQETWREVLLGCGTPLLAVC